MTRLFINTLNFIYCILFLLFFSNAGFAKSDILPEIKSNATKESEVEKSLASTPLFFLAPNGVTVRCPDANIGDTGVVDGITYTKRSRDQITPENASTTCTSCITDMSWLFSGANLNNVDISTWDVANVTDMSGLFNFSNNNSDLSNWNVGNVTDMSFMFSFSNSNSDLSNWNVGNVTNMSYMFYASNNNSDLSRWNVENVTDMSGLFLFSNNNSDLSNWNVGNVTDMSFMFYASNNNSDLGSWNVGNVTDMSYMFVLFQNNSNLSNWDVSKVTNMSGMFRDSEFNSDISNWNVGNVTNMGSMFSNSKFNSDISNWNVGNVTNMGGMFYNSIFNSDISNWNVGNVNNMNSMFRNSEFNSDISRWNVSKVTNMSSMFSYSVFNSDISKWDVSKVTNMSSMFRNSEFNLDINNWNVGNVINMSSMFRNSNFNSNISEWDVSNVTNMSSMFSFSKFNSNVSNWNVGKVTNMSSMFRDSEFNSDISKWDVSKVVWMDGMFFNATDFDQDLGNWNIGNVYSMYDMFFGVTLSKENYNSLLINWAQQDVRNNVYFHAGNSVYNGLAAKYARSKLINRNGWIITDGTIISVAANYNEALSINTPSQSIIPANSENAKPSAFVLTGKPDEEVLVKLSLNNPTDGTTFSFPTHTDLFLMPNYTSWADLTEISFTGYVQDVNIALEELILQAGEKGTSQLKISAMLLPEGYVYNEENGHFYLPVQEKLTYSDAKAKAESMTLGGINGYMATITSAFEDGLVNANISGSNYWISINDKTEEGVWVYDSGPENGQEATYFNWCDGEPNNVDADGFIGEHHVITRWNGNNCWNDIHEDNIYTHLNGYVVEFGNALGADKQEFGFMASSTLDLVIKYAQSISFDEIGEKTYGNGSFELANETTDKGLPIVYEIEDTSIASLSGRTITILKAGETKVKASQVGDDDHLPAESIERVLTISKAALAISATNQTKIYGQANPTLTFTYTGLVNGDTKVSTEPTISTTSTSSSGTGTYPITLTGGSDSNYDLTLVNGTLEVTKASATITAQNKTKVYGQANPTLTFTYTGLVNGDTKVSTEPTISTTATSSSGTGTYPITLTGGSDSNYDLTLVNGSMVITKASATVTAQNKTKVYGQANPTLTFTYTGLVNGDTKIATEPTVSTTATSASGVGTYPINLSGGADSNYNISYVGASLTIQPAVLTVTANRQEKVYGTSDPVLDYKVSGFVLDDNQWILKGNLQRVAGEKVGKYTIAMGTLSAGENYTITFVANELEILKAVVKQAFDEAMISTAWKSQPALPTQVMVLTEDGSLYKQTVQWDVSKLNVLKRGDYTIEGTLVQEEWSTNPKGIKAYQRIRVNAKPAPTGLSIDNNTFKVEGKVFFVPIGRLIVQDAVDNIHELALVKGARDNGYFEIKNNILYWSSAERVPGRKEFKVLVRVTDRDGNQIERELTLNRQRKSVSEIEIVNTITPNGDGKNDNWGVSDLRYYDGVTISIFEKSGTRVFSTNNPDERWNGTFNGKELTVGTYYWIIEVKETGEVRKGMVNLLR
jgi:gliding motility-associated-like protein